MSGLVTDRDTAGRQAALARDLLRALGRPPVGVRTMQGARTERCSSWARMLDPLALPDHGLGPVETYVELLGDDGVPVAVGVLVGGLLPLVGEDRVLRTVTGLLAQASLSIADGLCDLHWDIARDLMLAAENGATR